MLQSFNQIYGDILQTGMLVVAVLSYVDQRRR
ncbi:hypothetical protein N007_04935 [Alicyclobacillus acidoterrestris ATCC 49025]|nr:hypothetical protein N007_04935 [Alicyclobacillus acidoterrestris ATCC 49025]